jgi:FixJ family two-component response regulator
MSKKVLISIVDDNRCFREALEALMISMDYEVAAFGSGEDYLGSDCVARTSCLISDFQMPGMSGTESERSRMLNAGAMGVLPKPFDTSALIECLNRALWHTGL